MTTEQIILANLISNEEYARKSLPYVKAEYFADKLERLAYTEISKYVEKYNTLPTKESLIIEIDSANNILDSEYEQCVQIINGLKSDAAEGEGWLLDITEKFCQEKSLHNAIMSSISIIDGSDKNKDKGSF